jgi:hypothetical protein
MTTERTPGLDDEAAIRDHLAEIGPDGLRALRRILKSPTEIATKSFTV